MLDYLGRQFISHSVAAIEIDLPSQRATLIGSIGPDVAGGIGWDAAKLAAMLRDDPAVYNGSGVAVGRCLLPGSGLPALIFRVPITPDIVILVIATRTAGAGSFRAADERSARAAAEWLGGCVRLWYAFRSERAQTLSLNAALDLLAIAVIVVDQGGRLTAANRTAWTLLDDGDGVRVSGDRLRAATLDDSARLLTAIAQAAERADRSQQRRARVLSIRRRGRRPLAVAIVRGGERPSGGHTVIVHAVDPESDISKSIAPLCDLYGFTAAEARLIHLLVAGDSLADAAEKLGIQPLTARTYLKRMFEKTGTHRQGALIQLLLTSAVQTASDVELEAL